MFKLTRINCSLMVAFGIGAVVVGMPAQAQVEITGSAIRSIATESSLPVTTFKVDDLSKAGVTNAEQALQFVTSNQSSVNSATSVGGFVGGASYADLRGLGAQRTLVLLNGKRLVSNPYESGGATAVDLNTIPFGAVERIEVLADGASAIYGSDAIAGVVNFITRREFQGLNLTGSTSLPTQSGGGQVYEVGFTAGTGSLTEQGWNLFGGLTYRKQNSLAASDRSFAGTAYIPSRGIDYTSLASFPANYLYGPDDAFITNPSLPNCDPPASYPSGGGCGFDYARYLQIVPTQEQVSAIVKGTLAVNRDNTVSLEYVQGNNTVKTSVAPSTIIPGYVSAASPYMPGGSAGIPAPADPAFDPTAGVNSLWRTTELGPRQAKDVNKTDRFLLDWQGSYQGWDYSAAALLSNANIKTSFTGGYVGRSAVDDGLAGMNGAPWLNPFGPQTPAGLSYMQSNLLLGQVQQSEGRLAGIKFDLSGEIYKMPAGPLMMATVLEFYKDKVSYNNNFAITREAASSGLEESVDSSGSRHWTGLMFEFAVPVVKSLDVNLAARWDWYSDFGNTFNPKASFRWTPMKELLFRGSINSGFRAPSLYESYASPSSTYTQGSYSDPVLCPGGTPDVAAGAVDLRDCGAQFQKRLSGNAALDPETSTAWSAGLVFQPIASLSASVDYWNYKVSNSIAPLGESVIFADPQRYASKIVRCSQLDPSAAAIYDNCGYGGGDPIAYIDTTTVNLGTYKTSGVDLAVNWRANGGEYGVFSVNWIATYLFQYEYQLEPGGAYYNNLGTFFNGQPISRFRQVLNLGWQYDVWQANLINRYVSGYSDENNPDNIDPQYYNTVGAVNTWDLALTWTGVKGLTLTAGVTNLFNQAPPFTNQAQSAQVGYDSRYANPIGRAFLLSANYTF